MVVCGSAGNSFDSALRRVPKGTMHSSINGRSQVLTCRRKVDVRMPREITVMQLTWGWWYWSTETHKHRGREQTWRCLWSCGDLGPCSISCICPLGRYYSFTLRKLQISSWTLKLETPASSTSPDAHASAFVCLLRRRAAQNRLQGHKFCLGLFGGEDRRACCVQSPPAVADFHHNPRLQGQEIF